MYDVHFSHGAPRPMQNHTCRQEVTAPKSERGQMWWKIGIATVNMGLWCSVFNLEKWGPPEGKPIIIEWSLQGIPARSMYQNIGADEISWKTLLWWQDEARTKAQARARTRAWGWFERREGKWLHNSPSLIQGVAKNRRAELARLRFERPRGYEALGPLI